MHSPKRELRSENRMKWWKDARFGMFIHWGLYSIVGGAWDGKRVRGYSEWTLMSQSMLRGDKALRHEYANLVHKFNPTKFDARKWVKTAKDTGMKYIIITAKHHDGFCLFNTKLTDYNIVDSTPFKRDVIAELAKACRKEGLRFGIYYSQLDWSKSKNLGLFPRYENFEEYLNYMKGQLKELLTNYGQVDILWFDGDWMPQWNAKVGVDIENFCRSFQPNIIINDRVGKRSFGGYASYVFSFLYRGNNSGDYLTPEQIIPRNRQGRDWEVCMTINNSWGYKGWDNNWKPVSVLMKKLTETVGKGGNFLLNVGPDDTGTIPEICIERLKEMGQLVKKRGVLRLPRIPY